MINGKPYKIIAGCIYALLLFYFPCLSQVNQGWTTVDDGVQNGAIYSFYTDSEENKLYIGGDFSHANNIYQRSFSTLNNNAWDSIPSNNDWGSVYAINKYKDKIYVGIVNGFRSVLYLEGDQWIDISGEFKVGNIVGGAVRDLEIYDDKLLIGGSFVTIDDDTVFSTILWDGEHFSHLWDYTPESGVTKFLVNDITIYQGQIFASGGFTITGEGTNIALVKFENGKWVNAGIKGQAGIFTTQVYKNELYVGGYFFENNGNPGSFIQKWDGHNWHKVGGGLNSRVNDLMVYNDTLYACGIFSQADNLPARNIAKWDGQNWHKIDDSYFGGEIIEMAVYNSNLYIGGMLYINGDTVNSIARRYIGPEEQKNVEDIVKIFPNPVTDNLTLEYNLDKTSNFKFALYDALGNIVYQEENPTAYGYYHYLIPTLNLAQGLYIARIELNGHTMARKIIKQ
jgi:hypothetical protein